MIAGFVGAGKVWGEGFAGECVQLKKTAFPVNGKAV